MSLFCSVLQICLVLISAYDKGSHNVDVEMESFKYGEYYFNFYYVESNWDEAVAICKATHSRLAVVHTMERANFLAEALTRTLFGVEDVWIGGFFVEDNSTNGEWQWISMKRGLPSQSADGFPPWLNYPTKRGKKCLSLDRRNHSKPIFVELQCTLQRPFICEKSSTAHLTVQPTMTSHVKLNNTFYYVYYGRVTWDEALTFCKQAGSRLATVPTMKAATELVGIMQHLRPAIRNAWIGARRQNYGWIWTPTEEAIPNEKNMDTDFPPWASDYYRSDLIYKDCLALDHHVCLRSRIQGDRGGRSNCQEKAIFLPESCNLKKDFICESTPPKKRTFSNQTDIVIAGSIKYIYSRQRQPWRVAAQTCKELHMTLAMPATKAELEAIVFNLADVQFSWDHVWLGAKWNVIEKQWKWLNHTPVPLVTSEMNYLPWCKTLAAHEDGENCLNLDRDAHKVAVVYGFNCSIPQGFVCQFNPEDVVSLPGGAEMPTFVVHNHLLSHGEAEEACHTRNTVAHLAITNNFELAQNLSSILPLDTLVWLGGERIDSRWQWSRTKEPIPDFADETNYPPWGVLTTTEGKMCLAMQAGFRRRPQFIERPCKSKLPYVCELSPDGMLEPDNTVDYEDNIYYFYKQALPWDKANSVCALSQLRLPKVGNLELANYLSGIAGDEYQWWIDGKREDSDSWRWTTNGEAILPKIVSASWFGGANFSEAKAAIQCLLLTDSTNPKKLVGKNCQEKHEFICVKYDIDIDDHLTKQLEGVEVELMPDQTNFSEAKQYCTKEGMTVLNPLKDNNFARFLEENKISSVWINVYHAGHKKWMDGSTGEEFLTDVSFPDKATVYKKGVLKECAIFVIRLSGEPQIRRSDCNDVSHIMCRKDKMKTAVSVEEMKMQFMDKIKFIANFKNKMYIQARQFCKEQGAEMADATLFTKAISFIKTPKDTNCSFWVAKENDANVTAASKKMKHHNHASRKMNQLCPVILQSGTEKNIDCNDEAFTLCYLELNVCHAPPTVEGLKWSPRNCQEDDIENGRVCTATCHEGQLFGLQKIVCVKGTWVDGSRFLNSSQVFPSCIDSEQQSEYFLKSLLTPEITGTIPKPALIFVLDAGVSQFLFEIETSIIKHIINIVLLNQHRRAAVILYSKQARTEIDLKEHDLCDFTEDLKFLPMFEYLIPADFRKPLANVEKMLDENNSTPVFMFFFVFRKDAGSTYARDQMIKRLQKRNVVVSVLAVGVDRTSVEGMASIYNNQVQLYWFKNHQMLRECGNFLKQNRNSAVDTCVFQKLARA